MTNWMTAVGIAFIAGGLATLISLRSVLFGGDKAAVEKLGTDTLGGDKSGGGESGGGELVGGKPRGGKPGGGKSGRGKAAGRTDHRAKDAPGGLASIGLADEDDDPAADALEPSEVDAPDVTEPAEVIGTGVRGGPIASYAPIIPAHRPAPAPPVPDQPAPPAQATVPTGDEECRPLRVRPVDRADRRHGDRVDGWIRPEYHDAQGTAPSGEYWTPIPMDDLDLALAEDDPEPSAKGYGWPIPVERLPAVPDYEPATGFDLHPVAAEPTEVVPVWPPVPDRRVRLPRSWAGRNQKPAENRFTENEAPPRHTGPDERFRAPTSEPERRRPRPRPRPDPDAEDVYVSRHAAEPPG